MANIEAAGPPDQGAALLRQLSGLMPPVPNHAEKPYLDFLAQVPRQHPPDWTAWWAQASDHHFFLRDEPDRPAPEHRLLQAVAGQVIKQAMEHLPGSLELAASAKPKTLTALIILQAAVFMAAEGLPGRAAARPGRQPPSWT